MRYLLLFAAFALLILFTEAAFLAILRADRLRKEKYRQEKEDRERIKLYLIEAFYAINAFKLSGSLNHYRKAICFLDYARINFCGIMGNLLDDLYSSLSPEDISEQDWEKTEKIMLRITQELPGLLLP